MKKLTLVTMLATAAIGAMESAGQATGFDIGVAAYSFRKMTAFEAIDRTRACGGDVIEFFLWQKLSPDHPNVTLNQDLSDDHIAALKTKLDGAGVRAVNAYFNNAVFQKPAEAEANVRKLFEFARKLGLRGLTGEPPPEHLDLFERMVKEFGVQLCFHNHPRNPDKPEYRNWDPEYLATLMKGRDPRMGFSVDTGHFCRSGQDPIEAIRLMGDRVLSVHLKDLTVAGPDGACVPYGRGVCDLKGVLDALQRQGFRGHIGVEYETLSDRLTEDVAECIRFISDWKSGKHPRKTAGGGALRPPNVVLMFVDNLGNGDLGCTGSTLHRTPNLDRMAAEGSRFTSFYVASGVCTPSRAALMTGCYPPRVNMHACEFNTPVIRPLSRKGLHPDETTIADALKSAGYATGMFGKWHLGDQPPFLPTRQGFDEFFGIPYSDDMTRKDASGWPDLPLMRGETAIEAPADRHALVRRCTDEAVAFMERNRDRPFFIYLPYTTPGSTREPHAGEGFRGKSANGDYGDAVEELDWAAGEILATIRRLGLDGDTLVVWTSDNGAVKRNPPQGSCAPYKGFGYDTSEGAMRMPCLMRWTGRIPAGRVCDELCSSMDLLPTFAALAGAAPPAAPIDGHDIRPILFGTPGTPSPWDEKGYCYYRMEQLQAIRAGPWKLYLPLKEKLTSLQRATAPAELALFDVRNDVAETAEVSARHPDVVQRLLALAAATREEIGDTGRPGRGQRPAGYTPHPQPILVEGQTHKPRKEDGSWPKSM